MQNNNSRFPMYEKLFSKEAETKSKTGTQTMQKLFFSIKVTDYFRYLKQYDPYARRICTEVLKYSGYTEDSKRSRIPVNRDVTIHDMLKIADFLLGNDNLRHAGYFIIDMLLIRPFALYAEKAGRFGYPACHSTSPDFDDLWMTCDCDELPL